MSMHRTFTDGDLIVATHNMGKYREIADLLRPFGVQVVSARDKNLPEPVEDGDSFIANARIKALAAARATGMPALADDSGLCVDALDGAPGIYSARWADGGDFAAAMAKVEQALQQAGAHTPEQRAAAFHCALCLAWPDGHTEDFLGRVGGRIVWPGRGDNGFGYDAIFQPHGHERTFGEMAPAEKHAMSHRADAFRQLIDACFRRD